jgi:protoporphyrinogen oxidase
VAVIGGGFLGLTLARTLAAAGRAVTLYEAAPEVGGVSRGIPFAGIRVDRFYHTVLPTDTSLLALLGSLGLGEIVAWRGTKTGFYSEGRIHGVSNLREFLTFPVLAPLERLRLGWMIATAGRARLEEIERLTCEEWLRRTCGDRVYERLWQPLLRAKLGAVGSEVSASFIWSTLRRLQGAKRGTGATQKDRMGFVCGSYAVVIEALERELARHGVVVRTSEPIRALGPAGDAWRVTSGRGDATFDQVVSTLSVRRLHDALEAGGAPTAGLAPVDYLGVVVELLLVRRPLSPHYILNLADETLPMTGIIEMTNLAPPGTFRERSLLYLPRYVAPGDPFARLSDDEVTARFEEALGRVFPSFGAGDVVERRVERAPEVHRDRMPPAELAPGLFVASSAQVFPWPLNNDRVVARALEVARAMGVPAPSSDHR